MQEVQEFIDRHLLNGEIIFDQSKGEYRFEEEQGKVVIHANRIAFYERLFEAQSNLQVIGTCRIIAGALIGKLRRVGWRGDVEYYYSHGHVVPILSDGVKRFLVDIGRRKPVTLPVELDGSPVTSYAYAVPQVYRACTVPKGIQLEISGSENRTEVLVPVSEEDEECRRILESIRYNNNLLRAQWVDGRFTQTCMNEAPSGVERLAVRTNILAGMPAKVHLHDE